MSSGSAAQAENAASARKAAASVGRAESGRSDLRLPCILGFPEESKPNILCAAHILPGGAGAPCTLLPTSLMPSSSRFFLSALPCRPFWSESTSPDQPSYFTKAPECELPPLGMGMRRSEEHTSE